MTKLEKVVYSLERCTCHVPDACRDCAYDDKPAPECWLTLERDALELLKEQEKELKNTNTIYQQIKAHWCRRRQQADATYEELKFLVYLLDWFEADEPPKEGESEWGVLC